MAKKAKKVSKRQLKKQQKAMLKNSPMNMDSNYVMPNAYDTNMQDPNVMYDDVQYDYLLDENGEIIYDEYGQPMFDYNNPINVEYAQQAYPQNQEFDIDLNNYQDQQYQDQQYDDQQYQNQQYQDEQEYQAPEAQQTIVIDDQKNFEELYFKIKDEFNRFSKEINNQYNDLNNVITEKANKLEDHINEKILSTFSQKLSAERQDIETFNNRITELNTILDKLSLEGVDSNIDVSNIVLEYLSKVETSLINNMDSFLANINSQINALANALDVVKINHRNDTMSQMRNNSNTNVVQPVIPPVLPTFYPNPYLSPQVTPTLYPPREVVYHQFPGQYLNNNYVNHSSCPYCMQGRCVGHRLY